MPTMQRLLLSAPPGMIAALALFMAMAAAIQSGPGMRTPEARSAAPAPRVEWMQVLTSRWERDWGGAMALRNAYVWAPAPIRTAAGAAGPDAAPVAPAPWRRAGPAPVVAGAGAEAAAAAAYCDVRFDVDADGRPANVRTISCTEPALAIASVRAVRGWRYSARITPEGPATRTGLRARLVFSPGAE